MAKTASKKSDPSANPRSRAAKRATSPSIDIDKSIKETPRASDASPMLGVSQHSGIFKKKKVKQMTRGQRIRQEKGLARAEAVMDQMEKKVGSSRTRLRARQQRKGEWSEINTATVEEQRKATKAPGRAVVSDKDSDQDVNGEDDVDMGSAQTDLLNNSSNTPSSSNPNGPTQTLLSQPLTVTAGETDLIT